MKGNILNSSLFPRQNLCFYNWDEVSRERMSVPNSSNKLFKVVGCVGVFFFVGLWGIFVFKLPKFY